MHTFKGAENAFNIFGGDSFTSIGNGKFRNLTAIAQFKNDLALIGVFHRVR